jgi:hypothetical protein
MTVNKDVDGLNRNPSANDSDTIGACWHGEIDLEIVFGWHIVSFLCILANGYQKVTCQIQVNPLGTYRNLQIKLDDIRSMDIFGDAQMLTYLQIGELDVGLTFKEKDRVLQKAKKYHWKGQHLLMILQDGHV